MYDICAVNDSKKRKYLPKWTCIKNRPPNTYPTFLDIDITIEDGMFNYLFIYLFINFI